MSTKLRSLVKTQEEYNQLLDYIDTLRAAGLLVIDTSVHSPNWTNVGAEEPYVECGCSCEDCDPYAIEGDGYVEIGCACGNYFDTAEKFWEHLND